MFCTLQFQLQLLVLTPKPVSMDVFSLDTLTFIFAASWS